MLVKAILPSEYQVDGVGLGLPRSQVDQLLGYGRTTTDMFSFWAPPVTTKLGWVHYDKTSVHFTADGIVDMVIGHRLFRRGTSLPAEALGPPARVEHLSYRIYGSPKLVFSASERQFLLGSTDPDRFHEF